MIDRYEVKEISSLFTLKKRYDTFLKVELANIKALSTLGIVPKEDYEKIKNKLYTMNAQQFIVLADIMLDAYTQLRVSEDLTNR